MIIPIKDGRYSYQDGVRRDFSCLGENMETILFSISYSAKKQR